MRGKGKYKSLGTMGYGITPAYAGKRIKYRSLSYCTRDHPRLCGEKWGMSESIAPGAGSPPPMRGKVLVPVRENVQYRITPAYAGKSSVADKTFTPQRDQCH